MNRENHDEIYVVEHKEVRIFTVEMAGEKKGD
jgi:hypothetical protein